MVTNNSANYKPTQYNLQTGGATGTLNDVAPSATSGVPVIAQGAASQPVFGTALVAGGGTGLTSATDYAVLCGGTTSTGAFQSIASVGTSGQILTSNGAGALPTFQNSSVATKYTLTLYNVNAATATDSTTYFLCYGQNAAAVTTSGQASSRIYIPVTGTITTAYGSFICTVGSAQTSSIIIRLNNTSDTTVSSTINMSASPANYNNTGLSIAVTAGDYIEIKWATPAWSPTNPTGITHTISIGIT